MEPIIIGAFRRFVSAPVTAIFLVRRGHLRDCERFRDIPRRLLVRIPLVNERFHLALFQQGVSTDNAY